MDVRGNLRRFEAADYVLQIVVTGQTVDVAAHKARDADLSLAHDDPRLASLRAAVLRFIDGDAA
jgi:hypothetical protein